MTSVTLEEAQAKLPELIERQAPGEELRITVNGETVARLVTVPRRTKEPRKLGTMRGTVLSMEHFDDPLEEFEEYT
jgi:prevent-host-death family protein